MIQMDSKKKVTCNGTNQIKTESEIETAFHMRISILDIILEGPRRQ